jgi:hypothetical protein
MIPEPLTVTEAMASEHADEWRAAMDEEISNLLKVWLFRDGPEIRSDKAWEARKSKMGVQNKAQFRRVYSTVSSAISRQRFYSSSRVGFL